MIGLVMPQAEEFGITVKVSASRPGHHVLLVEDVKINQQIVVAVLERAGYTVEVTCDGVAALDAVQRSSFDAILMDVQMPIMGGLEATKRIRALGPAYRTLPIVALTANVLPEEVVGFKAAGMDDYVGKPFHPNELLAKVARWAGSPRSHTGKQENTIRSASTPIFDEARYATLRLNFNKDELLSLLVTFRHRLGERLDGLSVCAADGDAAQLAHHAHTVSSSAGLLGFLKLSHLCAELERAANSEHSIVQPLARLATVRIATERKLAELIELAAVA